MNILGINGGWGGGYQDTAAAMIIDGKLVAAVEEERLTRIKFAPGILPFQSIHAVLDIAGLTIKDVDMVAIHGETWTGNKQEKLTRHFKEMFGHAPALSFFHHHDAHAASSFFASGLNDALIITMDNSGDGISTQISVWQDNGIKVLKRYYRPQSLGIFYSAMTQLTGFNRDSDEYKMMGLAPYGQKDAIDLKWLLNWSERNKEYELKENSFIAFEPGKPSPSRVEMLYTKQTTEKIGFERRLKDQPIEQPHMNLAAAAQVQLEQVVEALISHYISETGIKNVCLAGGVAFNCAMNGRLLKMKDIDNLFIPPFAGDMGIAIGAAILASSTFDHNYPIHLDELVYLGKEFNDNDIQKILTQCKCKYEKISDPAKTGAALLAKGYIIGWFQGKAEFGPRALGNRSILADASIPDIKAKINNAIKFREGFRPFAPLIPEEDLHEYFESKIEASPYMTFVFEAKKKTRLEFPGVVHVDNTSRLQTVNVSQNPLLYSLLGAFKSLTGHTMLVNTSFNTRNQPMVYSPIDALETFFSSGIDALIIGNYLLTKNT